MIIKKVSITIYQLINCQWLFITYIITQCKSYLIDMEICYRNQNRKSNKHLISSVVMLSSLLRFARNVEIKQSQNVN